MKRVTKWCGMMTLVAVCGFVSACGQPEPPRTVSNFCVVAKRISAEPDPNELAGAEPAAENEVPGNQFDTLLTFNEVLAHNEVYDRLCLR
jgi:hypothetical protein